MDRFIISFGVTLAKTKLPWIMNLVQHLVHFCQIRKGNKVTFQANVKHNEQNTSIIEYSKTPPTQNKKPQKMTCLVGT